MKSIGIIQSLPLSSILGAPVTAAVDAQNLASRATQTFITNTAFDTKTGKAKIVSFRYSKIINPQGDSREYKLEVPVLSLLPIPYLRIDNMEVDFKVKITDTFISEDKVSSTQDYFFDSEKPQDTYSDRSEDDNNYNYECATNFSATFSDKKDSKATSQSEFNMESTLNVKMNIKSGDMPYGISKILNIFNDTVSQTEVLGE
jgi:hypothetical protein